jgi:predicted alpha/beta-fold hydrolase
MSQSKEATSIPGSATDFQSPWWLAGGHRQTLWRKFKSKPALSRHRQRFELDDGDFLDLDFYPGYSQSGNLVLLVHGLAGSSQSPYILNMQQSLAQAGIASAAVNLRSCSGEPNRLVKSYYSGCSEDIEQVVGQLLSDHPLTGRQPVSSISVIGYSLGANVLVKWLAETGYSEQVLCGASVSNPLRLDICCERMDSGLPFWYGRYFLQQLCRDLEDKHRLFLENGDTKKLASLAALGDWRNAKTLWEFDDQVTAPMHGFADARDYYQRCSSLSFIEQVSVPLLILHAADDPIIPPSVLPADHEVPPNVQIRMSPSGGHVGFVDRQQKDWLEQQLIAFIRLAQGGVLV